MEEMKVRSVFVVGAGFMGSGIAQVCAQAGLQVLLYDTNREVLEGAKTKIGWSLKKLYEKGKITEAPQQVLDRIKTATDLNTCKGTDLVIEAVFEDIELKKSLFREIDTMAPPPTVIASNT
ncbi:MAG: 3-hydroxyacyl-CoA dehydrogenase family protein, partial [Desulfatiglandales bacterium]